VDVRMEDTVRYSKTSLKPVTGDVRYEGKLKGTGDNYLFNYKAQNTLLPALYWLKTENKDAMAMVADAPVTVDGMKDTLAVGAVLFRGLTPAQAAKMAAQFGLDLQATKTNAFAKQHTVNLPRVAIYHTWYYTQDEGWARYTFEQSGIPYTSIHKDDLKKGGLRNRFDVILVPRTVGTASDFMKIDEKFGPMPYTKTAEFPSHGYPDSTNDMTGGPGFEGMAQLKQFAEAGGVIISLDNASQILANAGIMNELQSYDAAGLFHPGSVVNVKVRKAGNPVLYGFPEVFPVFKGNSPLLQTKKYDRNMMLLQYGTKPLKDEEKYTGPVMGLPDKKAAAADAKPAAPKETPYVLSGMVRNEQTIIGQGAIFNVPLGKGRVIAFTFDPLHRYLNLHDAALVWNALINWDFLKAP
jgi:hypothetical protein